MVVTFRKHVPLLTFAVLLAIAVSGCRDSQFGGARVELSPANPIPRLYPVRLVGVTDRATAYIEVDGVRKEFKRGDVIDTRPTDMRVLEINVRRRSVLLKKAGRG